MNDRFKFIKNFEKYSACTNGHIYSNDYNHTGKRKILKECIDKDGYPYVRFVINGKKYKKMVHRLIAETFIENVNNKPQVNHINGNKSDNRVENLEWVTVKENIIHSYKVLGKKPTNQMIKDFTKRVRGENNPKSKIDYRTACIIRKDRAKGIMLKYIARKFDISISQVSAICNNKFWKSNIYENKSLLESEG